MICLYEAYMKSFKNIHSTYVYRLRYSVSRVLHHNKQMLNANAIF